MNHNEKIEDIQALGQVLVMMQKEIDRVRSQAEQAQEYAPEAAKSTFEKLAVAEENWAESNTRLSQAREALDSFLEYAKIARDRYDDAGRDPTHAKEDKANRAREQADRAYIKLENAINRTRDKIQRTDNYINKAQSRVKIAEIKAQANEDREAAKKVRINFTLPENMKDDWQDLASDLSTSVSAMIREAMSLYTGELKNAGGDLERGLTKFGAKMEQVGRKVEDYVEGSMDKRYDPETGELKSIKFKGKEIFVKPEIPPIPSVNIPVPPVVPPSPFGKSDQAEKDRMKKRVTGLIRIQKAIPIPKLAQSLNISDEEAENIIYEIVAEGIEGAMKGDTFKFTSDIDDVIKSVHTIIDRM